MGGWDDTQRLLSHARAAERRIEELEQELRELDALADAYGRRCGAMASNARGVLTSLVDGVECLRCAQREDTEGGISQFGEVRL
jgi:cell division septum initiation protein DivIVA